ncbi:MAG: hypothetical protein ABJC89_05735 [Acidobacteriota bacterium]
MERAAAVVLVDSSAWIEVFRRPSRFTLESEVALEDVVTCLPIVQEVLQGFTDEQPFRIAREAMLALPIVDAPLDLRCLPTRSISIVPPGEPA